MGGGPFQGCLWLLSIFLVIVVETLYLPKTWIIQFQKKTWRPRPHSNISIWRRKKMGNIWNIWNWATFGEAGNEAIIPFISGANFFCKHLFLGVFLHIFLEINMIFQPYTPQSYHFTALLSVTPKGSPCYCANFCYGHPPTIKSETSLPSFQKLSIQSYNIPISQRLVISIFA